MRKTLILSVLALSLLLSACSAEKKKLVMGTEPGFAPYEYLDGNVVAGVDVDIANEIAKDLGMELDIKTMDFDGALLAVQQGSVDFVAAGVSVSEDRKENMDFSIEYAISKQIIVVNETNTNINGPEDLNGKKVAVQQGTVADLELSDVEAYQCDVKRYTRYVQAVEDLKNNKIDCIVMDILPATEIVKANPSLLIRENEVLIDKYAIAVKKGNQEMVDKINKTLKRLIDEGKIDEFTVKHTSG